MAKKARSRRARRVQGIDSSLSELTLRNGQGLTVELGDSILPTPQLTRTIGGSSSITLDVHDPELRLLQASLLTEKFDAQIDGLSFRYLGTKKKGDNLSITLEDRDIARLREFKGPKKFYRAKTTRAEASVSLIREALGPKTPITCPQLHVEQPIETKSQGKAAKEKAKDDRGQGVGDVKGLMVKGSKATAAQIDIGDRALRVAESLKAPFQVRVALIAALMEESVMGTASSNYLQLIPSTAAASGITPSDLEAAVHGFLTGYIDGEGGAIAYFRSNPGAKAYEIAQAVQRSGAGESSNGAGNYGPRVEESRAWVEAFEGGEYSGASSTVTEPYVFEVGKEEDYWTAIKRWAKEVNWRAFFVAGRFFLIDELELARGMIRLAVDRDTPGVVEVNFDYNGNKPVTEVELIVLAEEWEVPPGAVVTLGGYGPASMGFGGPPAKADKKGARKQGISAARDAKTGEGRARYIVVSIASPLRDEDEDQEDDDRELRPVTVKLRKPTAPLPEPAAETRTVSRTEGAGGSSAGALSEVSITKTSSGSPYWGGSAALFKQFFHPFMEDHGLSPGGEKEQGHASDGDHDPEGQPRGYATDYPTFSGEQIARELAHEIGWDDWAPNSYASKVIEVDGYRFDVQILSGPEIDHADHIHVGAHRV